MRKLFSCLALSLAVLMPCDSIQAKAVDLYVMGGQSNMQGHWENARSYPADPEKLDGRIGFYWVAPKLSSSGGKWLQLQPQRGLFPSGRFGPEITFARSLAQAGLKPAIFKYSSARTSLAANWLAPGKHGMYDDMVRELRHAIALQEKAGNKVTVRALVWIQGESDTETDDMAANYRASLRDIIEDFRVNVAKNPRLPVILGVDEQHPYVRKRPAVVEAQKRMALADSCTAFTSMIGLPKVDVTHLTPAGIIAHEERLHEAYAKLETSCR